MSCWEILGVEPDADRKAIKRAYGSLIKKHRPDDSPEEFRKIRDAYEEAIEYLQSPDASALNMSVETLPAPEAIAATKPTVLSQPELSIDQVAEVEDKSVWSEPEEYQSFLESFSGMLDELLSEKRPSAQAIDKCRETTLELLNRPVAQNINERGYLSVEVFELLTEKVDIAPGFLSTKVNLPAPLLLCLDDHFLWHVDEIPLGERFDQESCDLLFHGIHDARSGITEDWSTRDPVVTDAKKRDLTNPIRSGAWLLVTALVVGCYTFFPFAIVLEAIANFQQGEPYVRRLVLLSVGLGFFIHNANGLIGLKMMYARYVGSALLGLLMVVPAYSIGVGLGLVSPINAVLVLFIPIGLQMLYSYILSKRAG